MLDAVAGHAAKLKIGNGLDPDTNFGPLVSQEQWDRVSSYVQIGADEGARLHTGGQRPAGLDAGLDGGFFFQPTIWRTRRATCAWCARKSSARC